MEESNSIFLGLDSDLITMHIKDNEKRLKFKEIIDDYKIAITCTGYAYKEHTKSSLDMICTLCECENNISFTKLMGFMQKETYNLLALIENTPAGKPLFNALKSFFLLLHNTPEETTLPIHYGMYKRQVDLLILKLFDKKLTPEEVVKKVIKIGSLLILEKKERALIKET